MRTLDATTIAGSTLSQLGNWVNVTAVMVVLQERHGAAYVVAYFLVRAIAPYFFAKPLVGLVPNPGSGKAWAGSQAILAAMMLALSATHSNSIILLVVLAFAGILQSASSAWLMAIVSYEDSVRRKPVITAIATGTSVAVVAGPALGGVLSHIGGLTPVFLFDVVTFLAAIALVPWWRKTPVEADRPQRVSSRRRILHALVPLRPFENLKVTELAISWIAFGLFGGLLTAVETPFFADQKHFSADQIGFAISAHGAGGLVVFLASTFLKFSTSSLALGGIAVLGVVFWIFGSGWWLYVAFFVVGLGFSLTNSAARVAFAEAFDAYKVRAADAWAWVNQLSLLTSAISYLVALIYFATGAPIAPLLVVVVLAGLTCWFAGALWDRSSARRRHGDGEGHAAID